MQWATLWYYRKIVSSILILPHGELHARCMRKPVVSRSYARTVTSIQRFLP